MKLLPRGGSLPRQSLDRMLRSHLPELNATRVLDLGSKRAPYRTWVSCRQYHSLDVLLEGRPDIVGDGHRLPIRSNAYDAVIATQVLEHCHSPECVAEEVHRVLRPGGVFVVSVPFVYVIHGDPCDFWRFTEYALRHILRGFADVQIWAMGNQMTSVWTLVSERIRPLRYLNRLVGPMSLALGVSDRCPHGYFAMARKDLGVNGNNASA